MKKLMFAALIGLVAVANFAEGRWGRGCCPTKVCATPCAPVCEPEPPKCFKTVMVPKTVQVPQTVEVPARKIVTPQPDICERIAQPAKQIRIPQPPIPQPDKIVCQPQPDKIVYHKQPALVRYECPPGTSSNACAPNACAAPACPTC